MYCHDNKDKAVQTVVGIIELLMMVVSGVGIFYVLSLVRVPLDTIIGIMGVAGVGVLAAGILIKNIILKRVKT